LSAAPSGPFMPSSGNLRLVGLTLGLAIVATYASRATAQDAVDRDVPAHVMFVDGAATLERDGQLDVVTANMPVVPGDRLRTSSGRVEILFSDLTTVDVDEESTVDMLSQTLLRVSSGRVMLTVTGAANPSAAVRYGVDT